MPYAKWPGQESCGSAPATYANRNWCRMPFEFNIERDPIYECGAALLTVLAAPAEIAHERSLELHRSLCGKALWLKFLMNPDDWTPITVKPQYVFQDRETIDRDVR